MLFMLHIDVSIPAEMPKEAQLALRERGNTRAMQLVNEGVIVRIWRVVGRVANFSVWDAPTLEALHELVMSMPLFPLHEDQCHAIDRPPRDAVC